MKIPSNSYKRVTTSGAILTTLHQTSPENTSLTQRMVKRSQKRGSSFFDPSFFKSTISNKAIIGECTKEGYQIILFLCSQWNTTRS